MKLLLDEGQNICSMDHEKNKTSSQQTNNIKALLERLRSLKITNKASSEMNKQSDEEMFVTPAIINNNIQAVILKSIVLDLEWFNRDRMKFEDWWRRIQLFLKSNRVIETDDRITVILACLREGVVGIYV